MFHTTAPGGKVQANLNDTADMRNQPPCLFHPLIGNSCLLPAYGIEGQIRSAPTYRQLGAPLKAPGWRCMERWRKDCRRPLLCFSGADFFAQLQAFHPIQIVPIARRSPDLCIHVAMPLNSASGMSACVIRPPKTRLGTALTRQSFAK